MPLDALTLAMGGLVVLAVASIGAAARSFRAAADPAVRRLREGSDPHSVPLAAVVAGERLEAATHEASRRGAATTDEDAESRLRRQLVWAGFRSMRAPKLFVGAKAVLSFGLLLGFLAVNAARAEPVPFALGIAVWLAGAGFFLPNLWLSSRIANRLRQIDRALPDALDLLVTCVEAGLGLDAALQRVSGEIALAWPLLSSELRLTFLEVRAGIPRMDGFRRLAARTGSPELRALAATLTQTELFGTSIASALRVQAEGIRIRRMQRAEERAAYVAVKMTLPLILCILPSLFAVIIGPAAINIMKTLMPMLGGQR
ncbi:type II secretion system F family protein [Anaeromyxobacter sp. Fw109-5]|uniref:type II secretion system F family protein n=1 Tax=Anaeromyxobacter sp. (strain Fw109-5) TaxID=404589 RepID=UPI0000ED6C9F|nr:type II secretion system F family protein [Anaeromyxobacter sp. Fw109-5]ABS28142.1 type II secretion system protein [Anaeromyxobacter sp. Fw109-5]